MIAEDRKQELSEISIKVYQQLQAGYPIDKIKHQFDHVQEANKDEITWVFNAAKERYIGYYDLYKRENYNTAKWMIIGGLSIILFVYFILTLIGEPNAGRNQGRAIIGFIVGTSACCYGIFILVKASSDDRRKDLDQL